MGHASLVLSSASHVSCLFNLGPWQLCLCNGFFLSCSSLIRDPWLMMTLWLPPFVWVDSGHVATSEAPANPIPFILCCLDFLLKLICGLNQSLTHCVLENLVVLFSHHSRSFENILNRNYLICVICLLLLLKQYWLPSGMGMCGLTILFSVVLFPRMLQDETS